jgi:hypothetical protein
VSDLGAAGIPRRPFAGEAQLFQIDPPLPEGIGGPRLLFDGALELLDARVAPDPPPEEGRIRMSLTWRVRAPVPDPGQYVARVELIDSTGRIRVRDEHPLCYNIFPPVRWPIGAVVREDVWIRARHPIVRDDYGIGVWLEAYNNPRKVAVEALTSGAAVGEERAIAGVWRFR